MANIIFTCSGCGARFRVTQAPSSGRIKCPKCGQVSTLSAPAGAARPAPPPLPAAASAAPPPPPPSGPPPELAPGTQIAGHQIIEYLGGSEITAVYKASQISMGRPVAFKTLRSRYASDPAVKARFFAGARAAARLNHPNLLSVFDIGDEGGVCFFTTEFVDGGTLPQFLASAEKITSEMRLAIAVQIVHALAYAESAGEHLVWLSPESVLLTDKGDVRISHIGTGEPLSGGTPEPILNALRRLVYVAVVGKDLPSEMREPGYAGPVSLPAARDPLAAKLHAVVARLLKEGPGAIAVSVFTSEFEKLAESVQRQGSVGAAAPGGVVPIRLERARHRRIPVAGVVGGSLVLIGIVAIGVFSLLAYAHGKQHEREAQAKWDQARIDRMNPATRRHALRLMEELATEYNDTPYGPKALSEGVPSTKTAIVGDVYSAAEAPYADKPLDTAAHIAAVQAAREQLEREFPGFPLVREQADVRIQNVRNRYTEEANKAGLAVKSKITALARRGKFGDALQAADAYAKEWGESDQAKTLAKGLAAEIEKLAKREFETTMQRVEYFVGQKKRDQAEALLQAVISDYGIPAYVSQSQAKLDEVKKLPEENRTEPE